MMDAIRWRYWQVIDRVGVTAVVCAGLFAAAGIVASWEWVFLRPRLHSLVERKAHQDLALSRRPEAGAPAALQPELSQRDLAEKLGKAASEARLSLDELTFVAQAGTAKQPGAVVHLHGAYAGVRTFLAAALDEPPRLTLRRINLARRAGSQWGAIDIEAEFFPLGPQTQQKSEK